MKAIEPKSFNYLFILFHFICHTIMTTNKGKVEKKKWRGDLTETIGAYERLTSIEEKKAESQRWKYLCQLFSYLLNNLIFTICLKDERD